MNSWGSHATSTAAGIVLAVVALVGIVVALAAGVDLIKVAIVALVLLALASLTHTGRHRGNPLIDKHPPDERR